MPEQLGGEGLRTLSQNAQQAIPAPFDLAKSQMSLTPQEQFLYQYHLNNLTGEGKITQPNGDISTLLQAVVTGPDGRFYNIPTVWGGKQLTPEESAKKAAELGWDKWPAYASPEAADSRYERMHDYMSIDTGRYRREHR